MNEVLGIRGLGTDLVEIERFRQALARRASLPDRLFTAGEQEYAFGQHDPVHSLDARFGAKEAVMKALGAGLGAFAFRAVEVVATTPARRRSHCTAQPPHSPPSGGEPAQLSLTHTGRHRDGGGARPG
jgi:holo-[acyl-carrier protein] synthase